MHPVLHFLKETYVTAALSLLSGASLPISFNIYWEMHLGKSTWLAFLDGTVHTAMGPPMG